VNRAQVVGWVALAAGALAGCSARSVSLDAARDIPGPSFAPLPATPIESPQLDALVERDTAGVVNSQPDADPTLIAPAIDAVLAAFPGTTLVGDIYVIDRSVYMTIPDPEGPARSISIYYDGQRLSVGEPQFNDNTGLFPIENVHTDAIVALVQGLSERYPAMQVDTPRLDVSLSYGLGLSWRIDLNDARGGLATIWADLDGRVIAVESKAD
jgi:hypothetical protein